MLCSSVSCDQGAVLGGRHRLQALGHRLLVHGGRLGIPQLVFHPLFYSHAQSNPNLSLRAHSRRDPGAKHALDYTKYQNLMLGSIPAEFSYL